jgi:hypothetical protein
MTKLRKIINYIKTLTFNRMKEENIINKNMQWRLCDCTLDKGYCLCKTETDEKNKKVVE